MNDSKGYSNQKWTKKEIELLKISYNNMPKDKLLELFPRRTWCAIENKASKLGITPTIRDVLIKRNKSSAQREALRKALIGRKRSDETKEKVRKGVLKAYEEGRLKKMVGSKHPMYGKHASEKTKKEARKQVKRLNQNTKIQEKRLRKVKEWNEQHSDEKREWFKKANKDPDFIKKRLKALCKKPTKPEKKLIKVINKYSLPFKYVGDGSVIINNLNPDFINCNGGKEIIEVFSRYWHEKYTNIDWKRTEFGRKAIFNQLGYKTLIIWDDEMDNEERIVHDIKKFLGGDIKK